MNKKRKFIIIALTLCVLAASFFTGFFIHKLSDRIDKTGSVLHQETKETLGTEPDTSGTTMETQSVSEEMNIETTGGETEDSMEAQEYQVNPMTIVLDPGHGGDDPGASGGDPVVDEADVNLKIAQYLKKELEKYDGVTVYLTRSDSGKVELEDRINYAVLQGADLFVSLHNNAYGSIVSYDNGCTVLVPRGVYDEEAAQISQELGCSILQSLERIGIENQGLMFRICQNEQTYPNGEKEDYYFVIRKCQYSNIPGVLIEHCFIDDSYDYDNFLSTDKKIKRLAKADAEGIAQYYHLMKNGISDTSVLEPYEAKITEISTDYEKDNVYYTKSYYE